MNSEEINRMPAFILNNGGIIRSVNIILYDPLKGYLFTTEKRKSFPDIGIRPILTHLIGGKVDMKDKIPFETGLREFCEELPYTLNGYNINETVHLILGVFETCTKRYKDILVSKSKNLYNRFYIINISEIVDTEIKLSLYSRIENWSKLPESALESLFFWKSGMELKIKSTPLLESFILELPNEKYNKK
jgi:hypothetical protein